MDDFERDKMLACAYQLKDREFEPFSWDDPFLDMGTDEKSKLLLEFMNQNVFPLWIIKQNLRRSIN